jgi:hypothetical protein
MERVGIEPRCANNVLEVYASFLATSQWNAPRLICLPASRLPEQHYHLLAGVFFCITLCNRLLLAPRFGLRLNEIHR